MELSDFHITPDGLYHVLATDVKSCPIIGIMESPLLDCAFNIADIGGVGADYVMNRIDEFLWFNSL